LGRIASGRRRVLRRRVVAPSPLATDRVTANLRLAHHVLRRYRGLGGMGVDLDELYQVGCIGLVKAARRFDPGRGLRFSTYAVPLILGEIQRYLRDSAPAGLGRGAHRLAALARAAEERLGREGGRTPTAAEVAAAVGVDPGELALALEAARRPASLDEPGGEEGSRTLGERLAAPRGLDVDAATLRTLLLRLPPRERRIVELRYFRDRSQAEVGTLLGLSQPQISRLERRALDRLRAAWAGSGDGAAARRRRPPRLPPPGVSAAPPSP
jgi:RNA polymerase sigma factor (sigma-70 family)